MTKRKDDAVLGTIAAQLFPPLAQFLMQETDDDSADTLPFWMDKCVNLVKSILPEDQVMICQMLAHKCKINGIDVPDVSVATWYAVIVLDHDTSEEFIAIVQHSKELA